ncbi:MAG: hypothetical protein HQ547_04860 [Candidatus Omnitrophica bacterium]|nr:hypothetical protein [Candidatus Omnitrophota bacterium]
MDKKIRNRNNRKTYAIQCSNCKRMIHPQEKTTKKEFEQLALLEDLIKDWFLGKIDIFPEIPSPVKEFIKEAIHSHIHDYVFDILAGSAPTCCESSSYWAIKCKAQGR